MKRAQHAHRPPEVPRLFPGYPAGASLKPPHNVRWFLGDVALFPGYPAGASLKRAAFYGPAKYKRALFPGYPAGASLKP